MAQRVWNVGLVSLVFAASVVALEGCSTDDTSTLDTALQVRVERGRYLANNVAICSFCHTPLFSDGSRDWSRHLSGVDCFIDTNSADPEMGCLSTPNLTPAGLGNKTDDQIKALFQNGVRPDGTLLNSVHPYYLFHNMTDEDATALVAYLRSLPPLSARSRNANRRGPPRSRLRRSIPIRYPARAQTTHRAMRHCAAATSSVLPACASTATHRTFRAATPMAIWCFDAIGSCGADASSRRRGWVTSSRPIPP